MSYTEHLGILSWPESRTSRHRSQCGRCEVAQLAFRAGHPLTSKDSSWHKSQHELSLSLKLPEAEDASNEMFTNLAGTVSSRRSTVESYYRADFMLPRGGHIQWTTALM